MLDDFTPIIHKLDGRTIRIYAIADVHLGAKECAVKEFRRFVERIAADKDAYIVICGDVLNNGVKDSVTNVYEEVLPPHAQIETAVELLTPIKDKILGCVGGNHEHRTKKAVDLDPLYAVMLMLGKGELYRQNLAFVRVNLERGKTKDHYALLLVHGASAGKRNKFDLGAVEGVDAIIGGHVHSGDIRKNTRIIFSTSNTVKTRDIVSLTAVSWLDYGGYAARALHMPQSTKHPQCLELEFTGTNASSGNIRVIW